MCIFMSRNSIKKQEAVMKITWFPENKEKERKELEKERRDPRGQLKTAYSMFYLSLGLCIFLITTAIITAVIGTMKTVVGGAFIVGFLSIGWIVKEYRKISRIRKIIGSKSR